MRNSLIVLALVAAMLLPMPAASAAPFAAGLRIDPTRVVHEGHKYRLTLQAETTGTGDYVFMSLSRVKDPDGDGPLRSKQVSRWTVRDLEDVVSVAGNLATASVETKRAIQPLGNITYDFEATKPARSVCDGGRTQRRGRVTGTWNLRTGPKLGKLTLHGVPATVWTTNMRCDGWGSTPSSERCRPADSIFGLRHSDMVAASAWWAPNGEKARIYVDYWKELNFERARTTGDVDRSISTVVPRDHAHLEHDLQSGRFRGAAGTFTVGVARFIKTSGDASYSSPCDRNGQEVELDATAKHGRLSGDFVAKFFAGPDFRLADKTIGGIASRERILPR